MERKNASVCFMGGVIPNREDPEILFEQVVPVLKQ